MVVTKITATGKFLIQNRSLSVFMLAEGFMFLAFEMIGPFGVLLFTKILGGTPAEYGVLNSVFFLILTLFALPAGMFIVTVGLRTALFITYSVAGLSLAIRGFSLSPLMFAIGRILQSPSGALDSIIAPVMVSGSVQERNLGKAFSLYDMLTSVPAFIAPLAGALLIGALGYREMFGVAAVMLIIAAGLSLMIKIHTDQVDQTPSHKRVLSLAAIRAISSNKDALKRLSALLAIYLARGIGITAVYTYLPLYLTKQGLSVLELGILYSLFDLAAVVLAVPVGQLVDKTQYKRKLLLLDAGGNLAFAAICILNPPAIVAAGIVLIARIINMPGMTALSVQTSTVFEEKLRPQVFALRTIALNTSAIIAPTLAGLFLQPEGEYTFIFTILGISTLIYGILALFLR